jgi:hypothetical protein
MPEVSRRRRAAEDDEVEVSPRRKAIVEDDDDEEETPKAKRSSSSEDEEDGVVGKGWGKVARRAKDIEEIEAEKENAIRDFWLKSGETAIIQLLAEDPFCMDGHQVRLGDKDWNFMQCQKSSQRHCVMCNDGVRMSWRAGFKLLDYRGSWDKDKKKFKYDEPIEKLWLMGQQLAEQLHQFLEKKKRPADKVVLEVTRSGSGKATSYNISIALDDDDVPVKIKKWTEKYPSIEELCKPPTDRQLTSKGYKGGSENDD